MEALRGITQRLMKDVLELMKEKANLQADTRIVCETLYDHLSLTAGLAVAMVRELCLRGQSPRHICGVECDEHELLALARLCGLLHDIGKAKLGATEYLWHVQRGVNWTREWLEQQGIPEPFFSLVVNAVARHHLRNHPQTLLEKAICLADSYASAGDRPELAKAGSKEQLQQSARKIVALEQELFGNDKPVRLLLGDVDAIKGFVYEGQKLPEIRGASELLVEAEEDIKKLFEQKLSKDCLVYCGGGSFLAIVPANEAEALKKEVERLYLSKTKVATITVVVSEPIGYIDLGRGLRPYDDASIKQLRGTGVAEDLLFSHFEAVVSNRSKRKNFGEWVARLSADLRQAKLQKAIAPFFPTLPVHQRCQSCGKRAASRLDTRVTPEEWLCEACHMKREKGRRGRSSFAEKFAKWFEEKHGQKVPDKPAKDLDDLAGKEGRLAFLYADGNNMGDLLQRAKTPAQYRHISEALETAVKDALFEALVGSIRKENLVKSPRLPFEIIAIGGDDVTVIVPARYGWQLTLKFLQEFERHPKIQRLNEEMNTKLTMSAGLVIADVKYPVRFMQSLAESLLKEAKRLARKKQGESAICHLWLRTPIASENAKVVLETLYLREDKERRHLTARPFTLRQARKLTELAQNLKDLPHHQRRTLAESLEKGVRISLNTALYQVQRQLSEEQREQREKVIRTFVELGRLVTEEIQDKFFFWQKRDGEWRTALLDALELLELGGEG